MNSQQKEVTVIDESDYRLPKANEAKADQQQAGQETLSYLEELPWRPIGVEW
jgi:ElaB/YqjD/DUF883 family membrane-anchored ribosome-binding protein